MISFPSKEMHPQACKCKGLTYLGQVMMIVTSSEGHKHDMCVHERERTRYRGLRPYPKNYLYLTSFEPFSAQKCAYIWNKYICIDDVIGKVVGLSTFVNMFNQLHLSLMYVF